MYPQPTRTSPGKFGLFLHLRLHYFWGFVSCPQGGRDEYFWGLFSCPHGGRSEYVWDLYSCPHGGRGEYVWGFCLLSALWMLACSTLEITKISTKKQECEQQSQQHNSDNQTFDKRRWTHQHPSYFPSTHVLSFIFCYICTEEVSVISHNIWGYQSVLSFHPRVLSSTYLSQNTKVNHPQMVHLFIGIFCFRHWLLSGILEETSVTIRNVIRSLLLILHLINSYKIFSYHIWIYFIILVHTANSVQIQTWAPPLIPGAMAPVSAPVLPPVKPFMGPSLPPTNPPVNPGVPLPPLPPVRQCTTTSPIPDFTLRSFLVYGVRAPKNSRI